MSRHRRRVGARAGLVATVFASLVSCRASPDPGPPTVVDPPKEAPSDGVLVVAIRGKGRVTTLEGTIDCGARCFGRFPQGEVVTMKAAPAEGWALSRFTGDYACTSGRVLIGQAHRCVVEFTPTAREHVGLTIGVEGKGTVFFPDKPNAPGCDARCVRSYVRSSTVTMEPLPAEGWTFAWWEGDDDCRDSEVVLDRSSKCVAVFALDPDMQRRLHVDIEGSGSVVVNAPPTVSVCRGRCVRQANVGQVVVLRPEPDQARTARFVGFSGDPDCLDGSVTLDRHKRCVARFEGGDRRLDLRVYGAGTVGVSPGTAECRGTTDGGFPPPCVVSIAKGTQVRLDPRPNPGMEFDRFEGDCLKSSVNFEMDRDRTCVVRFRPQGPTCPGPLDLVPPSTPHGLQAHATSCRNIALDWQPSVDTGGCGVKTYEVRRGGRIHRRLTEQQLGLREGRGVRPGETYRYRVRAVDAAGNSSSWSDEVTVRTPACAPLSPVISTTVLLARFADSFNNRMSIKQAEQLMFAAPNSVSAFVSENTFGDNELGGRAHGWFVLPGITTDYCQGTGPRGKPIGCDLQAILDDVAWQADPHVDFSATERVLVVLDSIGDFGGVAGGRFSTEEGVIQPALMVDHGSFNVQVVAHEFGHAFGLRHAGSRHSGVGAVTADSSDPFRGACRYSVYGDPIDVMGSGWSHFSAYHKLLIGALEPQRVQRVTRDGRYDLARIETPSDERPQMLQIALDEVAGTAGDYYFLEQRYPVGFDTINPSIADGRGVDGVVIRAALADDVDSIQTIVSQHDHVLRPGVPFYDADRGLLISVLAKGRLRSQVDIRHIQTP